MRRYPKAPAVGSIPGICSSRVRCGGVFAAPGASDNSRGSGAPAGKLTIALLTAIALLLALWASSASAAGSYSTSSSLCSAVGVGGDQCGEIKSVAVDTSTGSPTSGHVYLLDTGNFRVNQYNSAGTFVRAFGVDVVTSGQHETVGAGAEVCEPANSTPVDVCKAGPSAGGTKGGAIAAAARGIAVDPVTHILYIVTAGSRLAYYDGATGSYLGQSEGNASNSAGASPPPVNFGAPEKFNLTTGVAIDSSTPGGPYLYVSITTGSSPNFRTKIDKFQAAGVGGSPSPTYICQITGTATDTSTGAGAPRTECGNPNPGTTNNNPQHKDGEFDFLLQGITAPETSQEGGNLAVDASGNLYISESPATLGANQGRHVVSVFAKTGNFIKQFKPSGTGLSATEPRPEALTILPSGNLALSAGAVTAGAGGNRIQEYDPATIPAGPTTVATPRAEFALPSSGASRGLSAYGTSLYVGDKTNKKALKYTQVPSTPDVTTGAATAISKFKATLHGTVNPAFATVTDCHFEYLTHVAYQGNGNSFVGANTPASAPCTPPSLGSGNNPVAVSANVSGLQFGTEYHVRAVASNSVGTTNGSEVTFTTASVNNPEAVTTAGATQIAQTTAKVAGKVNPNEVQITDCHFDYGTTTAYGQSAPCVPDAATVGAGETLVDVSASLSGLTPDTTYHFLLKATNGDGTSANTDDKTFASLPTAPSVSEASAEAGQIAASVKAKVNPNSGPNSSPLTACRIDYGTTTAYGFTKACSPVPGPGSIPADVSFSLTGLNPDALYFYRVIASNAGGSGEEAKSFFTLAPNPPTAFNDGSTEGPSDTFTLEGRVDPEGIALSDCHFAYGTSAEYGKTAPCTPSAASIGTGNAPVAVTAATAPLEPNTTYHFRLFASNVRGSTQGKDRIFTTGSAPADSCANAAIRAEQGIEVVRLPDCLALEQASPSKKGNQSARLGVGANALSPDGDRVLFNSAATLGSCPNINGIGGDGFIAIRDPEGGWRSECVTPPVDPEFGGSFGGLSFDPGLTSWVQLIRTSSEELKFFTAGLGISRTALSPDLVNLTTSGGPGFIGASADHSHVYLSPEGQRFGIFLPGDPVPTGQGEDFNLYLAQLDPEGHPSLHLAAKDSGGKAWGGNCGARLGGMETITGENLNLQNGTRNQGAISADGTHTYFSTRPSQPPTGECLEVPNKKRIMVREETPGGAQIEELLASECPTIPRACPGEATGDIASGSKILTNFNPSTPAGTFAAGMIATRIGGTGIPANTRVAQILSPTELELTNAATATATAITLKANDGDDVYQGASVDQSLVYFTTTRQLLASDLDGSSSASTASTSSANNGATSCDFTTAVSGCDLYLYDDGKPAGERLTLVSEGESTATTPGEGASVRNSITAISADGSHAYFVARTVLTTDPNPLGAVAQTAANNLYLYSYPDEDLSFLGTLASADGGTIFGGDAGWENGAYAVPVGATDSEGNEVGGNGHLLLFNTAAQLDPADTDSARDLYRYDAEDGTLNLLSKALPGGSGNGAFGTITSSYAGVGPGTDYADSGRWASEDANSVAFTTKEALFPGDTNGAEDSYLWRDGQLYHLPGSSRASASANQILPIVSRDGSTIAYHSTERLTASDIDSVEDVYVLRPGGGFSTPTTTTCQGEACQGVPSTLSDEIGATDSSGGSAGNATPTAAKCPKGKRKVRRGGKARCVKPAKHKKKSANKQRRTSSKQGGQK